MSDNSSLFESEDAARDEYEILLYGFSLKEFVQESKKKTKQEFCLNLTFHFLLDVEFVERTIKKHMKNFNLCTIKVVKDLSPNLETTILELGKAAAAEIVKSSKPDIDKVNDFIIEKFSIPDNVLLYSHLSDRVDVTSEEVKALRAECELLEQRAKEVN